MAKKQKPSVTLLQYCDPKAKPEDKNQYIYRVDSTKNCLEPVVGSYLSPEGVRRLISNGVGVSIKQP